MGLPSHLWSYFDKLDRYYGNNRSHHAAKCKACVEWQKRKLEIEDSENLALGMIHHRRSNDELEVEGVHFLQVWS